MRYLAISVATQAHTQVCMETGHPQNMQKSERSLWKPSLEESWGQVHVGILLTMALVRSLRCTEQLPSHFMLWSSLFGIYGSMTCKKGQRRYFPSLILVEELCPMYLIAVFFISVSRVLDKLGSFLHQGRLGIALQITRIFKYNDNFYSIFLLATCSIWWLYLS